MAGARVTEPRVVGACASSSSGFQRRLDGVEVVGAGELARRGDHASRAAAGRVDDALALGGGDHRALLEEAGEALAGVVTFMSGHAEKAREVVQGLGNAAANASSA